MQKQIYALSMYCRENKLHVNVPKTKAMYVSTREVSSMSTAQFFIYNSVQIANVSEFKYLGEWIDNRG